MPIFMIDVLKAAPALKNIYFTGANQTPYGAAALRSLSTALREGTLQHLEKVVLWKCALGDNDIREFAEASEKSGCAKGLVTLSFTVCGFGVEGARIVADLLSRGVFPALKNLDLGKNPKIGRGCRGPGQGFA